MEQRSKKKGGKKLFERASPIKAFAPFGAKKNCIDLHPEFLQLKLQRRAASIYSLVLAFKMMMNHIIAAGPVPIRETMEDELLLTNDIFIYSYMLHRHQWGKKNIPSCFHPEVFFRYPLVSFQTLFKYLS